MKQRPILETMRKTATNIIFKLLASNPSWIMSMLFVCCLPLLAQSQSTPEYQLLRSIPVEATSFTTDKLQQIYYTTPQNQLIKLTSEGQDRKSVV